MDEVDWKIDSYKAHILKGQSEAKEMELAAVENEHKMKIEQLKQAKALLQQLEAKKNMEII